MAEKLNVQPREEFGKGAARRIRAEHKIPAVVYGHGMDPVHLVLPGHETALAARNSNALLELALPDGTAHTVLVKDLQRHPLRRSNVLLLVVAATFVPLLAVVLWPGPAPLWLLTAMVAGMGVGGPASSVGFDFTRSHLASHRLGTATGIVIMGGFTLGLACTFGIGLVLDVLRPAGDYDLASFRWALALMLPVQVIATALLLESRARLRRRMAEAGQTVPSWSEIWRSGRWRHL